MSKLYSKFWVLILAGVLVFSVFNSCQRQVSEDNIISVSIAPLKYFVDQLTDGALEVNVMVPQGASHGTYAPTAQQMQKLSDSRIYFRIGSLGYEQAFIRRLKELNPAMKEVNLSNSVELIRGMPIDHGDHVHEGGIDPHIWMSPKVVLQLIPLLRDQIVDTYPDLQDVVSANYPVLLEKVEALHGQLQELTLTLTHRRFLIFHPALTYLARDYQLEQVSIEHEGKEPTPGHLHKLITQAKAEHIPVIFIQEEYDIRNAQLVASETNVQVVQINPLSYDWVESMKEIMGIFEQYMQ